MLCITVIIYLCVVTVSDSSQLVFAQSNVTP